MNPTWPTKKLGESSTVSLFDLYVSDIDVTTGNLQDHKKSEKLRSVIDDVKGEKLFAELSFSSEEKNFGYGADWVLILVEWFSKSDVANALANFGGMISLAHAFSTLLQKLKSKREKYDLRVGLNSAKLLALDVIARESVLENNGEFLYKFLLEYELSREVIAEEKDFIFVVRKQSKGVKSNHNDFFVHINWLGDIKEIKKL